LPRGIFLCTAAKTNILIAKKLTYRVHKPTRLLALRDLCASALNSVVSLILTPDADWRPEAHSATTPVSRSTARLGDLFHLRTGFARYAKQRELFGRPAPVRILLIRAKNLSQVGGLRLDRNCAYISKDGPMFRKAAGVRAGELLFVRVGVGCYGRAAVMPQGLIAQADDWIHILTPKAGVDAQAVADWLNAAAGRVAVQHLAKGVGTLSVSKSSLANLRVPARCLRRKNTSNR
jgi:type I restriction enzyme M protein